MKPYPLGAKFHIFLQKLYALTEVSEMTEAGQYDSIFQGIPLIYIGKSSLVLFSEGQIHPDLDFWLEAMGGPIPHDSVPDALWNIKYCLRQC